MTKCRTKKRIVSLLLAIMLMVGIAVMTAIPAGATEDEVREAANGVLHMTAYFNGDKVWTGSCFLVNDDTVITANHCVHFEEWEYDYYRANYRLKQEDIDELFTYTVTIARDVAIPMTLINSSENMEFAILKLSQPINNRTYLKLRDSKSVQPAETAYSVGFPGAKESNLITAQYYNLKDIAIESGTVNRAQYTDAKSIGGAYDQQGNYLTGYLISGDLIMLSGGTFSSGNSGGPMVDAHGNVIGVVSHHNSGACFATAISQVMEVLEALGIEYTDADAIPATEAPDTEPTASPATQPVVTPATQTPATEAPATTSESNNTMLIVIIAAAVVVVALIIIFLLISKKNKSKQASAAPAAAPTPSTPAAPAAPVAPQPYSRPPMPPQGGYAPSNEGAGETSVLSAGAGETTVLSGQGAGMMLVRKSNGEKIKVSKPEFVIGKELRRVDYCISDNSSISRTHAKLRVRSGRCYISDLGSTNCTFVNGTKLSPNQEVILSKGDIIKLSDEEFTFEG